MVILCIYIQHISVVETAREPFLICHFSLCHWTESQGNGILWWNSESQRRTVAFGFLYKFPFLFLQLCKLVKKGCVCVCVFLTKPRENEKWLVHLKITQKLNPENHLRNQTIQTYMTFLGSIHDPFSGVRNTHFWGRLFISKNKKKRANGLFI